MLDFMDKHIQRFLKLEFNDPFKPTYEREPGQALREKMLDRFHNAVLAGGAFFGLAIVFFVHLIAPQATTWSIIFIIACSFIFFVVSMRSLYPLMTGLKGERHVARALQKIERNGGYVMHDLQAPGYNVDHLVICRAGVFAVETKYIGRPEHGKNEVRFDGEKVFLGQTELKKDAVRQARSCASAVKATLKEMGEAVPVRGVVIYPGYFVKANKSCDSDVWVRNANYFVEELSDKTTLGGADVDRIYRKLCDRLEKPATLS